MPSGDEFIVRWHGGAKRARCHLSRAIGKRWDTCVRHVHVGQHQVELLERPLGSQCTELGVHGDRRPARRFHKA
eukprot:scaffold298104_cov31-Tisochrysis_lutea.AAC.1